jgi:epoxyqueuosine reductase
MASHRRQELEEPDLLELLRLDESAFRARFRDTPLYRAKRRGLLRNVCVALGNVGSPAALPALGNAAADPEPLVAEHARWAMAAIRARSS